MRFLGMIGYYRRFIQGYSTVLAPLTDLLAKRREFVWGPECEAAFHLVKYMLSHHPILRAPDFDKPFLLATDASCAGAGAVLMQRDGGIEYPVSYYSKKFNSAQRNYSTVEKELLAIILALRHFQVYIPPYGPVVTIFSDHHPLRYLNQFHNTNMRLTRWSLELQAYNLEIRHIAGKENVVADALSRVEGSEEEAR